MDAKFSQLPNILHSAAAPVPGESVGSSAAQPNEEQAAWFPFSQGPQSLLEILLEPSHPLVELALGTCDPLQLLSLSLGAGWREGLWSASRTGLVTSC